jgi:hypothetical protein
MSDNGIEYVSELRPPVKERSAEIVIEELEKFGDSDSLEENRK